MIKWIKTQERDLRTNERARIRNSEKKKKMYIEFTLTIY